MEAQQVSSPRRDGADDTPVAVVIPAYNASATLAETLSSVAAQTHAALEIVVVDDGSTDDTRQIAEAFAKTDARVRVISTPNGGVARARNSGIAATTAEFVAPVDADDLWHPEKIARQLAVIKAGGPQMGFVYTPFRKVDTHGRVFGSSGVEPFEGWVYLRHLSANFVGNGSSLLIRRAALEEVGGYEPLLRDAGCQGTEDYLLQLLIARRWRVGLVPDYLVGYRRLPNAMSADPLNMARSHLKSLEIISQRCPETPRWLLDQLRARHETDVFLKCVRRRQVSGAARALGNMVRSSPLAAAAQLLAKVLFRLSGPPEAGLASMPEDACPPFLALAPGEGKRPFAYDFMRRRQMRWAEPREGPPRPRVEEPDA